MKLAKNSKLARGICGRKFCKNKRQKGRSLCPTCISRKKRGRDHVYALFRIVKDRAKRRGREFTITVKDFRDLCERANFSRAAGLHLDRDDATEGYHIWNIVFRKSGENIAKGNRERHCPRYQAYLAGLTPEQRQRINEGKSAREPEPADVELPDDDRDPF